MSTNKQPIGPMPLPEAAPGYGTAYPVAQEKEYHGKGAPHMFPAAKSGAHTYGHDVTRRVGAMRISGHPGAHRIGGRKK